MFEFKAFASLLKSNTKQQDSSAHGNSDPTARIDAVLARHPAGRTQVLENQQHIEEYQRRQEHFLGTIGPEMRFGVDFEFVTGAQSAAHGREWEARLMAISASERGRFLVDLAHCHQLRRYSPLGQDWGPGAPQFRFKDALCVRKDAVLKEAIEFTTAQAVEFLERCISAYERNSGPHFTHTKRLLSALEKAISQPDQGLATRLRNCIDESYQFRWAKPLLRKLCPIEAAAAKAHVGESTSKEVGAADEALMMLQSVLLRLRGMWVEIPSPSGPFWGTLNHQMFSYYSEVAHYAESVELAALADRDVSEHKSRLTALRQIARGNLAALESGHGQPVPIAELSKRFPPGEKLRLRNPYWTIAEPQVLKDVVDERGQPKIATIVDIERRWLKGFEEHCERIFAIQPRSGLSRKIGPLVPSENAAAPTKTWLKQAKKLLSESDVREILERLRGEEPRNPRAAIYDPSLTRGDLQDVENKALEFQAMVWAAHLAGPAAAEQLHELALRNYQKIPGIGPKNAKLGNAAATSLALIEDGSGVPYLLNLQQRVKYPKIKKLLEQRITEASHRQGHSKQDMEELSVADHGFA